MAIGWAAVLAAFVAEPAAFPVEVADRAAGSAAGAEQGGAIEILRNDVAWLADPEREGRGGRRLGGPPVCGARAGPAGRR